MTFNPLLLGAIQQSGAGGFTYSVTGTHTTGTDGLYTWIKWSGSGSIITTGSTSMDIFVCGGGGSGGAAAGYTYGPYGGAGGGGGGAVLTQTGVTVNAGTHNMSVAGGGTSVGTTKSTNGYQGGSSVAAIAGG